MTALNEHDLFSENDTESGDMLAARTCALELLDQVLIQRQPLDVSLEKSSDFNALPSRDKAFVRMIVGTVLRRLGQIDDLISKCEERPGSLARNLRLHNILRLGIAQIMFMNVPDHASVDTTVRLCEAVGMDRQKGFVNGLLRTIIRMGRDMITLHDPARMNTPEWLLKLWIEEYGLKGAADIANANLSEAPLDISVRDQSSLKLWAAILEAEALPTGSLRRQAGGNVTALEGFSDGMWWVQDASSALPAQLFGDIEGKTVIDLCAAPGGKTAQLASMGAHVIAVDRSAQRMKRLNENLTRLRLESKVETHIADGAVWRPKESAKYVLCDAPCSATGTLRRHPDVAHLKNMRDVESLVEVQKRLLANAFEMLVPGGILVYCTCSLQKVEGEHQITEFIKSTPNALRLAIAPEEIGGFSDCITEHGDIRVLPHMMADKGGMDGFYVARIKKMDV